MIDANVRAGNSPCSQGVKQGDRRKKIVMTFTFSVPPTGIEPVHLPPEGSALSPELRGP